MKTRRFLISSIPLLAVLWTGGCTDSGAPTAPAGTTVSLAGAWDGTIIYLQDSDEAPGPCPSEGISTTLFQNEADVIARFATSCEGTLDLAGRLEGNLITGVLKGRSHAEGGHITGVVSDSRIQITTTRGKKGEVEPVNRIELVR